MKSITLHVVTSEDDATALLNGIGCVVGTAAVIAQSMTRDATINDIRVARRAAPGFRVTEVAVVAALRREMIEPLLIRENGQVATPEGLRHWSEVYPQFAALVDTWSTK